MRGAHTYNSQEEMKGIQRKKSSVKIKWVNVLTLDNDNGNDILFVSSYCNAHGLFAVTNCDMHIWIVTSGASFHVIPHLEWFFYDIRYCPSSGQLCM